VVSVVEPLYSGVEVAVPSSLAPQLVLLRASDTKMMKMIRPTGDLVADGFGLPKLFGLSAIYCANLSVFII